MLLVFTRLGLALLEKTRRAVSGRSIKLCKAEGVKKSPNAKLRGLPREGDGEPDRHSPGKSSRALGRGVGVQQSFGA